MSYQHVCAIVTTYNPRIERFQKVIDAVKDQIDRIIIVDNGSANLKEIHQAIIGIKNGEIIENNRNYGIGKALNIGLEKLISSSVGVDYILTLDQDSIVLVDIENVLTAAKEMYKKSEIGIVSLSTDDVRRSGSLRKDAEKISNFVCNDFPIISGSLVYAEVYKRNIRYREEFFMDQIDFDFGYNVKDAGFRLISTVHKGMDHELGTRGEGARAVEPYWRIYLLVRNSFTLLREGKINTAFFLLQFFSWYYADITRKPTAPIYKTFKYCLILFLGIIDAKRGYFAEPESNMTIKKIESF